MPPDVVHDIPLSAARRYRWVCVPAELVCVPAELVCVPAELVYGVLLLRTLFYSSSGYDRCRYTLYLIVKGWPGWVGLGGCLNTKLVPTWLERANDHPSYYWWPCHTAWHCQSTVSGIILTLSCELIHVTLKQTFYY